MARHVARRAIGKTAAPMFGSRGRWRRRDLLRNRPSPLLVGGLRAGRKKPQFAQKTHRPQRAGSLRGLLPGSLRAPAKRSSMTCSIWGRFTACWQPRLGWPRSGSRNRFHPQARLRPFGKRHARAPLGFLLVCPARRRRHPRPLLRKLRSPTAHRRPRAPGAYHPPRSRKSRSRPLHRCASRASKTARTCAAPYLDCSTSSASRPSLTFQQRLSSRIHRRSSRFQPPRNPTRRHVGP